MPRKKDQTWETEQSIFPSKLSEIMKERRVSQEKLANALGVKRQTVSLYKTGQSSPNVEQLCKIADYFSVSTDYLLGKAKEPTQDQTLQSVCKYTGLSSFAIDFLHRYADVYTRSFYRKLFDDMLRTDDELHSISYWIFEAARAALIAKEESLLDDEVSFSNDGADYKISAAAAENYFLMKAQEYTCKNLANIIGNLEYEAINALRESESIRSNNYTWTIDDDDEFDTLDLRESEVELRESDAKE